MDFSECAQSISKAWIYDICISDLSNWCQVTSVWCYMKLLWILQHIFSLVKVVILTIQCAILVNTLMISAIWHTFYLIKINWNILLLLNVIIGHVALNSDCLSLQNPIDSIIYNKVSITVVIWNIWCTIHTKLFSQQCVSVISSRYSIYIFYKIRFLHLHS